MCRSGIFLDLHQLMPEKRAIKWTSPQEESVKKPKRNSMIEATLPRTVGSI
jgi:hypothetical protein